MEKDVCLTWGVVGRVQRLGYFVRGKDPYAHLDVIVMAFSYQSITQT